MKRELEAEFAQSEWLQRFRNLSQVLKRLKAEVPMTQLCELEWVRKEQVLVVHCPNTEVWESLQGQEEAIAALNLQTKQIILQYQTEQIVAYTSSSP